MSETYTLDQIERALRVVLSTKTHPQLVALIVEDTCRELRDPDVRGKRREPAVQERNL